MYRSHGIIIKSCEPIYESNWVVWWIITRKVSSYITFSICYVCWFGWKCRADWNSFHLNLLQSFPVMITWGRQWTPFGSVHMLAEHNCTSARTQHSCFMRFMTDFTSLSSNWNIFCDNSEDSCLPFIFVFMLLGCRRSSHLTMCLRGRYTGIMIACGSRCAATLKLSFAFQGSSYHSFFPWSNWNKNIFRMFSSFSSFLEIFFLFYNVFSKLQFYLHIVYYRVLLFLSFFLSSAFFKLKSPCIQCTQLCFTYIYRIYAHYREGIIIIIHYFSANWWCSIAR